MRLIRRVAIREWPPRAKKLSSMPTRGTRSTSAYSPQRISSFGERGPRPPSSERGSGAGRALRSTLPFGVSGMVSRATRADGTM